MITKLINLRIAIINKDPSSLKALRNLIKEKLPNCAVSVASSSETATIKGLLESNPDVLVIQVQLQNQTAFELLIPFPHLKSEIIFIGYNTIYMDLVGNYNALAYFTQPVHEMELMVTFAKAEEVIKRKQRIKKMEQQIMKFGQQPQPKGQIKLPLLSGKIVHISPDDIVRCEANGDFTKVVSSSLNITHLMADLGISTLQKTLEQYSFYQIHRSHLVNIDFISDLSKLNTSSVIKMESEHWIPVARRRKADFKRFYKNRTNRVNII